MAKNIVICCDGTGNEFTGRDSNVLKLYKTLVRDADQVAYYQPGLGTMGARNALTSMAKRWTRLIGLAFGYGISDSVASAYEFLMHRFEPNDRVYLFGFSRGAYTVRVLCGMLHLVGLLPEGHEGLIPYAIRWIKAGQKKIDYALILDFKRTFSRECKPYFVGAWDTVSSVGWIFRGVRFRFTEASSNPDVQIIRHAVSIGERRAFFRQHLFGNFRDPQREVDVREVWFAGVHSDVGGGYLEPESQLSKISLRWMLCEAELAGLKVDSMRKAAVLGGQPPFVAPDPATGYQHESLHGLWWLAEFWPRIVIRHTAKGWVQVPIMNLSQERWIAPNSLVHESVEQRLASTSIHYRPYNLPKLRKVVADTSSSQVVSAQATPNL